MARKAVIDAVEARLAANWTLCPVIGVNTTAQTPADGSAFLTVQYPVANEEQASIGAPGSNIFREEGGIRFVLNVERGAGLSTGLQWADALASLFRGAVFSGVRVTGLSSPAIDDRNDDGLFFQLSLVVLYEHDITA
jgi:hypothetical protein